MSLRENWGQNMSSILRLDDLLQISWPSSSPFITLLSCSISIIAIIRRWLTKWQRCRCSVSPRRQTRPSSEQPRGWNRGWRWQDDRVRFPSLTSAEPGPTQRQQNLPEPRTLANIVVHLLWVQERSSEEVHRRGSAVASANTLPEPRSFSALTSLIWDSGLKWLNWLDDLEWLAFLYLWANFLSFQTWPVVFAPQPLLCPCWSNNTEQTHLPSILPLMASDKPLCKTHFDKHTVGPARAPKACERIPPPPPTLRCSHPDVSVVPLRKLLLPSAVFTAGLWIMLPASVLVTELYLDSWVRSVAVLGALKGKDVIKHIKQP